ncbi:helix-turn-helix domain-containing protein [Spirosoma endophyticum]|uniref:Transcriptional regulator, AraC family n=1 Tax=Spirosoma endophyticum TaxID=662367 RepID=A0A1I1X357_9BACT|nr:AraC family transcriptional regulator [Spirosoma endophyticum]SFE01826.1 transcriptional regulator, AraC family [Spirosoma endophyticum]
MENQSIPYYDNLPDFLKAVKSIDSTNRCFGLFPFEQFGGPGEVIPPFRSSTYVAALVTEGTGTIHLDGVPYSVQPGTLYFLRPWTVRSIHKQDQWHGYVLMFTSEYVTKRSVLSDPMREYPFYRKGAQPLIHIAPADVAELYSQIELIDKEFAHPTRSKADRLDITYHLLQSLMIKSRQIYRETLSATDYSQPVSLVERFQSLLQMYYLPDPSQTAPVLLTVHEAADRLHIHPHYLSDILKKYTGKTALQHIRERTAFEAQNLIRNTDLTVAEIGYRLNFEDPSNFTKFFKSIMGITPRAYRDQLYALAA